jgi:hypothetical protein
MQQIIMCYFKFKCRNWKNKLVLDFRIQTNLKLYMMFLCLPRICVNSLQNISPNLSWPSMCVWLVASFVLTFGMWNSSSHVLMLGSNYIIWNSWPTLKCDKIFTFGKVFEWKKHCKGNHAWLPPRATPSSANVFEACP